MIETILAFLVAGILAFLLFKAVGNILKGLILLLIAFIIYFLVSTSLPSFNLNFQPVGNFLKAPLDKIKNVFYSLDIVAATPSKNGLIIVVKNVGLLPLTNFSVRIDDKNVKLIADKTFLLPKQVGILEVEWEGGYHKIEVLTKETKATYISPL